MQPHLTISTADGVVLPRQLNLSPSPNVRLPPLAQLLRRRYVQRCRESQAMGINGPVFVQPHPSATSLSRLCDLRLLTELISLVACSTRPNSCKLSVISTSFHQCTVSSTVPQRVYGLCYKSTLVYPWTLYLSITPHGE